MERDFTARTVYNTPRTAMHSQVAVSGGRSSRKRQRLRHDVEATVAEASAAEESQAAVGEESAAAELTARIREVLTCAICVGPLRQCVTLVPCGHLFCKGCIASWARLNAHSTCPICRSSSVTKPVPLRAVDEVSKLLLGHGTGPADETPSTTCSTCAEPITEPSPCELCEHEVPMCPSCAEAYMGRCDDCERWFCDDCAGRHCRWCRLRGHPSTHVCWDCTHSSLGQCPSPLNGGL